MILVLQKNTPEPAIRQLLAQLALQNVKGGCVAGETSILLPLVGETWRLDPAALQALPYVQEARRLTPAYHLAARSAHPENTVVPVGDVRVGADFCLIAGPCAVESAYQIQTVAAAVKAAGAVMLRGGAFKPRTSPYTPSRVWVSRARRCWCRPAVIRACPPLPRSPIPPSWTRWLMWTCCRWVRAICRTSPC